MAALPFDNLSQAERVDLIAKDPFVLAIAERVDMTETWANFHLSIEERLLKFCHHPDVPPFPPPTSDPNSPLCGMDQFLAALAEQHDWSLIEENLRLTPGERLEKFARWMNDLQELRAAQFLDEEEEPAP